MCFNFMRPWEKEDYLFDLEKDYRQNENLIGKAPEIEERLKEAMKAEIIRQQAPRDHIERLEL